MKHDSLEKRCPHIQTMTLNEARVGVGVLIGVMEKKMETTIIGYISIQDFIGIMEKKVETTILCGEYSGYVGMHQDQWGFPRQIPHAGERAMV